VAGCGSQRGSAEQPIVFTEVPVADHGGPDGFEPVQGKVLHAGPGDRVVLYAQSDGLWYLQPASSRPFTEIKPDLTWNSLIHLGDRYGALLVHPSYTPVNRVPQLPTKGGPIAAVVEAPGNPPHPRIIHFSGYDWEARSKYGDRGGKLNPYDPDNVRVDEDGSLHLRITRRNDQWSCAEVSLRQSLGHGLYSIIVRDVSQMDPAASLVMYTWGAGDRFHREVDVEVTQWGDPQTRLHNAQFVVQPYFEPSNVSRFEAPVGLATFSFHWKPGDLLFSAAHGLPGPGAVVASHRFTSGIPDPGGASFRINLYAFGKAKFPMQAPTEVIIERFIYSP
jgi:hypothetical protein